MAQSLLKENKTKKKEAHNTANSETVETLDTQPVLSQILTTPIVPSNPNSTLDSTLDMPPPKTIVFQHIKEDMLIETPSPNPPDCFKSIMENFNSLPIDGKSRILPYLLKWITKRDIKYFILVTRADSEYTEREATIIDSFNLLPELRRRKMFFKIASYFSLKEIDYQIIQDDKWLTPYIQRVAK
jgi:hypothetical protein